MMREGTNEIIVGEGVIANYENIAVGKTVRWGNADWVIVGRFSDDGGIAESEAWADARLVQQVWNRGTSFQSVRARLADASDATLKKLKDTLTKDPRVQVAIQREPAVLRGTAGHHVDAHQRRGLGVRDHDGPRRRSSRR